MKIVLAAINAKYIHSNLAVYCLKAYAQKYMEEQKITSRPDIEIAEYTINQQIDDILRDLYKKQPDLLCFSCYIWNLSYVEELIEETAKIMPDAEIWLGGPEVSYDSVKALERFPQVAGVMKGEGEETFSELVIHYAKRRNKQVTASDLENMKGITYRCADDTIRENPWREIMNLSKVPFVYDDMEKFRNKIIYYESSRGCPFSCSYCLSSVDKSLRFRDLELVKQELAFFITHQIPQVKFVDRTFNCNHEHAMTIWKFIHEHDNGITNFHFEVSADLLNEEELQLIEQMRPGLIQLEIGVQSTNEETIRAIRRTMRFEEVAQTVKRINRSGNVHQHLDLIAGLPHENYESFAASFNDVYALRPEQLQLGFLKVLKGSFMEEKKNDYELLYKSKPPYEVLSTKWLPYKDVLRLKKVEEMTEVYYNSRQFTYTMEHLVTEFESAFACYEALGNYYEEQGLFERSHSRVSRYDILLDFIRSRGYEEGFYKELLTFDFYLRENAKNRPDFAGEEQVSPEMARDFYDREAREPKYLIEGYEGREKRKLRKMTHMERFTYNVTKDMQRCDLTLLFDYQNRNPLNQEARVIFVAKINEAV